MPPKSKTTKPAKGPKALCIRCPDLQKAENQHDLAQCFKQYSTVPESKATANENENETAVETKAEYETNDLWFGFSTGPVPNTLDLSDKETCKRLINTTKEIRPNETLVNFMDTEVEEWKKKVENNRAAAKFGKHAVTKSMLEAAATTLFKRKSKEEKAAEKTAKKQASSTQAAKGASAPPTNTLTDPSSSNPKLQTESLSDRTKKSAHLADLPSGSPDSLQQPPSTENDNEAVGGAGRADGDADGGAEGAPEKGSSGYGDRGGDGNGDDDQPNNSQTKADEISPPTVVRQCTAQQSHRNQAPVLDLGRQVRQPATRNSVPTTAHDQIATFRGALAAIRRRHEQNVQSAALPPKDNALVKEPLEYYALRASFGASPSMYSVLSNHFTVTIPPGKVLYEYHIMDTPDRATRVKRRMFVLDMIECDPMLYANRNSIATDYKKKIISYVPLLHDDQAQPGTDVLQVPINSYKPGTREQPEIVLLRLRYVSRHDLDGLRTFCNGTNETYKDSGAAEAMNIVIAKAVADGSRDTFQVGNNRFYYRPAWSDLQCKGEPESAGLIGTRGYYSAIKPAMGSVLLNVNTVTSAFYRPQTLDQYLDHFYNFGDFPGDLDRKIEDAIEPDRLWQYAQRHLSGLRVWVNFSRAGVAGQDQSIDEPNRRTKTLAELGVYPQIQSFTDEKKKGVQVWKHIKDKYPRAVKQGDDNYPTGNVGKKAPGPSKYYLARQLLVIADQSYRRTPMPSDVTAEMIKIARRRPKENYAAILGEGVASLGLHGQLPPMLHQMGIQISQGMIRIPARSTPQPNVVYRNNTIDGTGGSWRPRGNTRFFDTTIGFNGLNRPNSHAVVQFFKPAGRMQFDGQANAYIQNFMNLHAANGLQRVRLLDQNISYEEIENWDLGRLKQLFQGYQGRIHLAIVMFPNQSKTNRDRYANFKIVMDQQLGMKSICFNEQKICGSLNNFKGWRDEMADRALVDYIRNIAMKLNLRCGNFNHTVRDQDLKRIGGNTCDTIVLGADVTHPGAGSLQGTPSIAAVVGSVDNHFALFPASMRLNTPRDDIIVDMKEMTYERLRAWSDKNNGRMPTNILYYRDGVGDSMYARVRSTELLAVREAWGALFKQRNPGREAPAGLPKLTAVVVTKRHHTRLYPLSVVENAAGPAPTRSGNCQPGTVVDSGITSPYYFDFYLQSHHSLQGTARPAHYFVLENEMNFSSQDLQDLTYALCFTYGKSTTSVSYAPPAYYADRLCERGRLYLKPLLDGAGGIYKGKTEQEVWDLAEGFFYRGGGGLHRRNPWHDAHEGKMFWM